MKHVNIIARLTATLVAKGVKPKAAQKVAVLHLQKAGVLRAGTTQLTDLGKFHDAVPSAERTAVPTRGGHNTPRKY